MREEFTFPRCMIAAAGSGGGKTTVTCGIIGALKKRGFAPVSFKCGPDYIDPMFHRTVLGVAPVNLDTFLAGIQGVRRLVADAAASGTKNEKRPAVMEGVMGIYDGMSPGFTEGSCYEIASVTETPVILVINASGAGRTLISIIKGILSDDDKHLIRGIILNRMSDAFYERFYPVITDELAKTGRDICILGNIPKTAGIDIGSRHLGLKLPEETEDIREKVGLIADLIEEKCDLDMIIKIMSGAPDTARDDSGQKVPHPGIIPMAGGSPVIAVAKDEAFCFYYPENLRLFEKLGVEIKFFSPLHDEKLPEGVSALLLGGGYPELYLDELSANTSMLTSVRGALENGMPSLAECGGFMYLHETVEDTGGKPYSLVGAVDGRCTYTGHLVNFGYVEVAECDSAKCLKGMRGHEFHYYDSTFCGSDALLNKPSTGRKYRGMIVRKGRLWGFAHLYYPSAPEAVYEFVRCMAER